MHFQLQPLYDLRRSFNFLNCISPTLWLPCPIANTFGFTVNKFGFIGKSSDTFSLTKTLPNYRYFPKSWPNFGPLCVAQFQISFDSFDPALPPATTSHCRQVFVCFLRKLSSRVKRAAPKGPPPSISVKSRQSFRLESFFDDSFNPAAAMYQWSLCLCDKRVIPWHMKPCQYILLEISTFWFFYLMLWWTWLENMNQGDTEVIRVALVVGKVYGSMGLWDVVQFIMVGWSELIMVKLS